MWGVCLFVCEALCVLFVCCVYRYMCCMCVVFGGCCAFVCGVRFVMCLSVLCER